MNITYYKLYMFHPFSYFQPRRTNMRDVMYNLFLTIEHLTLHCHMHDEDLHIILSHSTRMGEALGG